MVRYIHKVNDHRAYLPTPSSQVLQCPGGPLQRVRVWAFRQEGKVGLYYRRMPQHLNPFGGLSSIWQRSHTIPLQKQRCDMKKQVSQTGKHPKSITISIQILIKGHSHWHKSAVTKQLYFQWATVSKVWLYENVQLFKCQCEVSEENMIRQKLMWFYSSACFIYTLMFKSLGLVHFFNASEISLMFARSVFFC